jgi:hypothetical protein
MFFGFFSYLIEGSGKQVQSENSESAANGRNGNFFLEPSEAAVCNDRHKGSSDEK